jgi:hypothetical protein
MRFDMICTKNGIQRVDWTNRHANTPKSFDCGIGLVACESLGDQTNKLI